ncbi:MAG: stage III sporulation protein AE [Syntrophomonadaceae bacterium]|nr:stage III sporulation protein AE [Syntrophomonadaceae bacterium]
MPAEKPVLTQEHSLTKPKTWGWSLLVGFLLVFLLVNGVHLAAATDSEPVFSFEDTVKDLDLLALEEYRDKLDNEVSSMMEGKPLKEWLVDFIRGDWKFNIKEIGESFLRMLFREILANSNLLGKILILSVISALLINLQTAFSSSVAQMSYLACFMALCAIALTSFKIVLGIGQQTIDNMVGFMTAMLPQMLVLTAGLGNINASAMLFPLLMTVCTAFATTVKNIVFPLIILSAILNLVNHMSNTMKVERMGKFFTQLAQLSLGFFLTIFVGIISLRAVYAATLDKVALRTTKFVTDNAIPVVGKMFSDTIEVAAGYIVMIKQALGIYGVLVIVGMILAPMLKIGAIALIYKVSAAIVEPLGDSRTAGILEVMSTHIFLMLATVAAVGLMFFIMIAIVAGMANNLGMLR